MPDDRGSSERALIAVVSELVRELHPQRAKSCAYASSSRLEQDLGIDSLGRTELILRIERAFRLRLPVNTVAAAETIGDLLRELEQAAQGAPPGAGAAVSSAPPALPQVSAAQDAKTLVDVLDWHVAQHPDRPHLTLLQDDVTVLAALTYGELAASAKRLAFGLIERDIGVGDRVGIMLPTSIEFFSVFFGILYAGAVPVPIYPPMRLSQIEDHLCRQAAILRNAGACILVTVPEAQNLGVFLQSLVDGLTSIESFASLTADAAEASPPSLRDDASTALLQYTSGSTGDPKGVVLSHANLLANIRALGLAMEASSADIFVSWLPLYHDMGLIGAWLGCLYFAAPLYVMSPMSFLARPQCWLWAIHRFRATLSASPNFGFELCLDKIEESDLRGLDLGSLRMVANGAEPVSAATVRRFIDTFSHYGFRPGAMAPVYGLAENAVGLAFPPPGRTPIIDRVDRESLGRRGIAEPALPDDPHPLEIVACGRPLPGHEIRVVDDLGLELADRCEGRIEFCGPSATSGYFRNEAKTRDLIRGDWLDTGDHGYMANGDIYVTGRIKDIIIRAGRHIFPQEIEEAIAGIAGIRKGCVAAFGVADPASGTERVVVLAETRETDSSARAALEARAQQVVATIAGAPADEIVLAPTHTTPKTSSGKIRRIAAKEFYLAGRIGAHPRAVWLQILRLSFAGAWPSMRRSARMLREFLYAAWWWVVIAVCYVLAWFAVMALPRLAWRWSAVRAIARSALRALATPVSVIGVERIPKNNAMLVFNHSSYTDVVLLAAVLPAEPAFVAKKELAAQLFAGPFTRRLGTLFVERHNIGESLADAKAVTVAARQGHNVVFFPEGGFTRRAALSEFHLGAFKVAAEAGMPILPGVLRGTRSMLRGEHWFPRRSSLSVEIGEPIQPAGADFAAVVALRDRVRQVILAKCGEPNLGELERTS
ncbi:AMP-binding protein [Rhodoblastus sp. 17X3]|uniref:AMP-binding protein n=1 Tax=Rhodoblastus sp. 17X3 TaxID=3047026 RepID=UPI0024B7753D|nr:AMP-binding protein [Rhodoblastus sp. 17X3]MDI9848568.1 AMP-binding protein [Rhodoblastus sp. 17X3]